MFYLMQFLHNQPLFYLKKCYVTLTKTIITRLNFRFCSTFSALIIWGFQFYEHVSIKNRYMWIFNLTFSAVYQHQFETKKIDLKQVKKYYIMIYMILFDPYKAWTETWPKEIKYQSHLYKKNLFDLSGQGKCSEGWKIYGDKCFKFSSSTASWDSAKVSIMIKSVFIYKPSIL